MYHVVYITDTKYWMHLYVSLYSLIKNNIEKEIITYILTDEVNETFMNNLPFLYEAGNMSACKIITINPSATETFPINAFFPHITKATYYRLFIGQLLPKEVTKALYLDCDTIIESSLEELFKTDLLGHVLGAVPDILSTDAEVKRLDLPQGSKYFNAGILLINLKKWREMKIYPLMLEYIEKNASNPEKIGMNDQDVLNAVLFDKWLEINPRYNFQEFGESIHGKDLTGIDLKIIHFFCYPKPWHYLSEHPLKERYWYYLRQTPFDGYREEDRNIKNICAKLGKRIHYQYLKLTRLLKNPR